MSAPNPQDDSTRAYAAQLRMEGQIKMFEAALVMRDANAAEQCRSAAHEQLDIMLDAKSSAIALAFQNIARGLK